MERDCETSGGRAGSASTRGGLLRTALILGALLIAPGVSASRASAQQPTVVPTTDSVVTTYAGSRWTPVIQETGRTIFADLNSFRAGTDGFLSGWIKWVEVDQLENGRRFAHRIMRTRLDCEGSRLATLSATYYSASGDLVDSWRNTYAEWQDAIPDSLGEFLITEICGYLGV
jgi:hypothetical protein